MNNARPWLLVLTLLGVIAATVWIDFEARELEREARLSDDFRELAAEAYDAISRCDQYHRKTGGLYQLRLLEAENALDKVQREASGPIEFNAVLVLHKYLLAVETSAADWTYFYQTSNRVRDRNERLLYLAGRDARSVR